jgi:hypothetical protein
MKKYLAITFMILTMFSSLNMAHALRIDFPGKIDFTADPIRAFVGDPVKYTLEAFLDQSDPISISNQNDSIFISAYLIDFEGDNNFDIKSEKPIETKHIFKEAGIFTSVGRVVVTKKSDGIDAFTRSEDSFFDVFTRVEIIDPGAPVPEPATLILLSTGLIGMLGWGKRKYRKS